MRELGARAGSGYLTAVMGELVGDRGHVLGVERHAEVRISSHSVRA